MAYLNKKTYSKHLKYNNANNNQIGYAMRHKWDKSHKKNMRAKKIVDCYLSTGDRPKEFRREKKIIVKPKKIKKSKNIKTTNLQECD